MIQLTVLNSEESVGRVQRENKRSRGPRSYDVSRRREKADAARRTVVTEAGDLFRRQGFGATTIAEIARAAGVSAEFVYKNFGGKPGLVRAIYAESLRGLGPVSAEDRSDVAQASASDPHALMRAFGRFVAEIAPLGSPVYLLIRDAAASGDADMRVLLDEIDAERHQRMLLNARRVLARGLLRPGLSEMEVADVFFASTEPGLYEALVLKRGWAPQRLGEFVATMLCANLVDPPLGQGSVRHPTGE